MKKKAKRIRMQGMTEQSSPLPLALQVGFSSSAHIASIRAAFASRKRRVAACMENIQDHTRSVNASGENNITTMPSSFTSDVSSSSQANSGPDGFMR